MPDESTVRLWAVKNVEGFYPQYEASRNIGLDAMADEIMEVVDGRCHPEDVSHRRLRFDARRWYLSKLAPKRYGDKQETTVKGDADTPLTVVVKQYVVSDEDAGA